MRHALKQRSRPAPIEHSNRIASPSADANPSARFTASGRNVTSTTKMIFGSSPKPNQITNSGAIAMIGMVCEATISG